MLTEPLTREDWGPPLITHGIWRPVTCEAYDCRIAEFFPSIEVSADLSATFSASFETVGRSAPASWAQLRLVDPHGHQILSYKPSSGRMAEFCKIDQPQLWWPRTLGKQPLYTAELVIRSADGDVLDQRSLRIGARRLRLVQERLQGEEEPSRSFVFEANQVRFFASGCNWIPNDSFYTRENLGQNQCKLLKRAADANFNMVRVWGGGVYHETQTFYDTCDELGLLVWQDFGFACGIYPAHDSFLTSVRREAEVIVRSIRHRPSLALLCGNNEDYQVPDWVGITWNREDSKGPWQDSAFPAREIYERVLPELVERLCKTQYHPGSPYSGTLKAGDLRTGDTHVYAHLVPAA